jgi:PAS domain S-box-containing protein
VTRDNIESPADRQDEQTPQSGLFAGLSIRRKLMSVIMVVSLAAMLTAGSALVAYQMIVIRQRIVHDLMAQARLLEQSCIAPLSFDYDEDGEEALSTLREKPSVQLACVFRSDGSVFAVYRRDDFVPGRLPTAEPNGYRYEDGSLLIYRQIQVEGELLGTIFLRSDLHEMSEFIEQTLIAMPISFVAAFALAYLLARRMQRMISNPVITLTRTAQEVTEKKDYSLRAEKQSDDELGVLTTSFNSMLAQVQSQDTALRQSRENLQVLFDTLDDFIFVLDNERQIVRINPVVERRLGFSAAELVGKSVLDVHPQDQQQKAETSINDLIAGKISVSSIPLLSKEGALIPVESKYTLGHWGGREALFGVSRDVSERIRTQEALRFTQFSVDHSADAAFWMGPDARFIYVNHAASFSLGYTRAELLMMTMHDIDPDSKPDTWPDHWREVKERGSFTMESRQRARDGRIFPVEITVNYVEFEGNEYNCAFVRDISKRKLAEEELRRLRNLLGNIVDSMPSVLVGVDTQGKVTQWNREAEKATLVAAQQARGRMLPEVFPQLSGEMGKVFEAIRSFETQKDLKVATDIEGERRYSDVTVYPLIDDAIEGAVIRIDDVTERVRIEELMIQSEKMLSVGGLAAGMAHEINNPLAGILQNVQVIQNRLSSKLRKNQQVAEACGISIVAIESYLEQRGVYRMIDSIISSGRRAAQIVENMLSFSRKSAAEYVPHDLAELLDKTVELVSNDYDLSKRYDFRQIRIVRDYDAKLPEVPCEASKIQQVFLNILRNGAEAMAESRSNTVQPQFTLRLRTEGDMVRIEIEDNGPGMEEEVRRRAFEPFFTTKGVGFGTGLGLSVSYFIITENHFGTMDVSSKAGIGSNFIIRLPLERSS